VAVFPLLSDPAGYHPWLSDLTADADACAYWLDLFDRHFEVHLQAAGAQGITADRLDRARRALGEELDLLRGDPARHGRLDIMLLDQIRRAALATGGIADEFRLIKERENAAALAELPDRLRTLDALPPEGVLEELARGALAGNLFDMGEPATAGGYQDESIPFAETLARVPPRPWRFDGLDALARRLAEAWPRRVTVLVDNAGGDVVLGTLPIVRHLLHGGSAVVIAANRRPSLNDVTHPELLDLLARAQRVDPIFAVPALRAVDSGGNAPLIDLRQVSDDLAEAARGSDLLLLVGMGRSIESNWNASFVCPCWRIAMLKNPEVARTIAGELYDAICRFDV